MLKYKQEKLLGKGGFGSAFLASRKDGSRVVIKEVRLQGMSRKEVDDAKKEASFLASVRHPNIVAFIESFTENGKLYLVMEYADGGDLAGRIAALKKERKSMSEDEALAYFVQICLAVKHLHDRRIVHRDIKGANVGRCVAKAGSTRAMQCSPGFASSSPTLIARHHRLAADLPDSHGHCQAGRSGHCARPRQLRGPRQDADRHALLPQPRTVSEP